LERRNLNSRLEEGDLLVFDVDGVLIDTRRSYPSVIRAAIQWGWERMLDLKADCTGFSFEHFRVSKRHPGFNDDYDIAWVLLSVAAARSRASKDGRLSCSMPSPEEWEAILQGFPPSDVVQHTCSRYGDPVGRDGFRVLCEEMYLGEHFCGNKRLTSMKRGLWHQEKPLLNAHWSELSLPAAIYTGRFLPELKLALIRLGWEDFPPDRVVTPETGISKPSPDGFSRLCQTIGTRFPIYFGDTGSDRESLRRFGRGVFVAIGGLLPEEALRFETVSEALTELGFLN
jgi:phosphoglycolate phosphatase-like HAD superfamily hydrolase